MLVHTVTGPTAAGRFLVTYQTPGCCVPTLAADCSTQVQAENEALRLNCDQVRREEAVRRDQVLRGLVLMTDDLTL